VVDAIDRAKEVTDIVIRAIHGARPMNIAIVLRKHFPDMDTVQAAEAIVQGA
jgi:hypothetical protein